MPTAVRKLIDLPEDYTDLLNLATTYECPNNSRSERKSKSVAMCLVCGALVCFEVRTFQIRKGSILPWWANYFANDFIPIQFCVTLVNFSKGVGGIKIGSKNS